MQIDLEWALVGAAAWIAFAYVVGSRLGGVIASYSAPDPEPEPDFDFALLEAELEMAFPKPAALAA